MLYNKNKQSFTFIMTIFYISIQLNVLFSVQVLDQMKFYVLFKYLIISYF
jgi:hypothetical protein